MLTRTQILAAHLGVAQAGDGTVHRSTLTLAEIGGEQPLDRAHTPLFAGRRLWLGAIVP